MHFAPESLVAHKSRRRHLTRMRGLPHRYENVIVACDTIPEVSGTLHAIVQRLESGRDPVPLLEILAEAIDVLAEALCLDIYAELATDLMTVIDTAKAVARRERRFSLGSREILACGPLMTSRLVARWLQDNGVRTRWVECSSLGVPRNAPSVKLTTRWGRALKRKLGGETSFLITQERVEPQPAHELQREADLVPS